MTLLVLMLNMRKLRVDNIQIGLKVCNNWAPFV